MSVFSRYLFFILDLSEFFKWVELTGYTINCKHLIDNGDLSSAVSLATPILPTQCWSAEEAILWVELSIMRGEALAKDSLDSQTFLKTCWCYHGNIKLHKTCITNRKRSRDVLADSSPELPHPTVVTKPHQWTEEDPNDDIVFRSDQSSGLDNLMESKGIRKVKYKGGRGKKSSKRPTKQKVMDQPHPQLHPRYSCTRVCSEELWPAVEMFLFCYQLIHPVCYSLPLRDVCLWIASCIGHHNDQLTAYFLHRSHGNMLQNKMVESCRRKFE